MRHDPMINFFLRKKYFITKAKNQKKHMKIYKTIYEIACCMDVYRAFF